MQRRWKWEYTERSPHRKNSRVRPSQCVLMLKNASKAALYDLAAYVRSQRPLQKLADFHSEEGLNHLQNSKNRRDRRKTSPSAINDMKTSVRTPKKMAMTATDESMEAQIGSSPKLIFEPATQSKNGFVATYVNRAPFCRVLLEKLHRQTQYQFVQGHLCQKRSARKGKNSRNLLLETPNRFG